MKILLPLILMVLMNDTNAVTNDLIDQTIPEMQQRLVSEYSLKANIKIPWKANSTLDDHQWIKARLATEKAVEHVTEAIRENDDAKKSVIKFVQTIEIKDTPGIGTGYKLNYQNGVLTFQISLKEFEKPTSVYGFARNVLDVMPGYRLEKFQKRNEEHTVNRKKNYAEDSKVTMDMKVDWKSLEKIDQTGLEKFEYLMDQGHDGVRRMLGYDNGIDAIKKNVTTLEFTLDPTAKDHVITSSKPVLKFKFAQIRFADKDYVDFLEDIKKLFGITELQNK